MRVIVLGATGNIGRHTVKALLLNDKHKVFAATRDKERAEALFNTDPLSSNLRFVEVDMTTMDEGDLAAALAGYDVIVVTMPQAFSPADMLATQEAIAKAIFRSMERTKEIGDIVPLVIKLSSYGIDGTLSQGALGEAHRKGEREFRDKGIPLVSIRPTSFFSNFEAYDWPSLRAGSREIRSPLGKEARVNWVACEDVGRVIAAVIEEHRRVTQGGTTESQDKFRVVDVVGPAPNTLRAPDLCHLVGECLGNAGGKEAVTYLEAALPTEEGYRGLWSFLRAGGFDVQGTTAEKECRRLLGGRPLMELKEFVAGLVRDMEEDKKAKATSR